MTDGYWRLYCWIHGIKICRKCGERLPEDYKRKPHKETLCDKCQAKSIENLVL